MFLFSLCRKEARRIRILPTVRARCLVRCHSQTFHERRSSSEAAGERLGQPYRTEADNPAGKTDQKSSMSSTGADLPTEEKETFTQANFDTDKEKSDIDLPMDKAESKPPIEADKTEQKFTIPFAEYRKLKKSLKMRSRVAGIPMGFIGICISSAVNIQLNPRMFEMTPEEIQPILGMDPIMLAAACGLVSSIMGFTMGGAIFTATLKLIANNKYMEVQRRDKDFLQRLQKYRYSGVNKYEDDYYGDKVMTLSDYRQWVRQQQKRREVMEAQNLDTEAAKKS